MHGDDTSTFLCHRFTLDNSWLQPCPSDSGGKDHQLHGCGPRTKLEFHASSAGVHRKSRWRGASRANEGKTRSCHAKLYILGVFGMIDQLGVGHKKCFGQFKNSNSVYRCVKCLSIYLLYLFHPVISGSSTFQLKSPGWRAKLSIVFCNHGQWCIYWTQELDWGLPVFIKVGKVILIIYISCFHLSPSTQATALRLPAAASCSHHSHHHYHYRYHFQRMIPPPFTTASKWAPPSHSLPLDDTRPIRYRPLANDPASECHPSPPFAGLIPRCTRVSSIQWPEQLL